MKRGAAQEVCLAKEIKVGNNLKLLLIELSSSSLKTPCAFDEGLDSNYSLLS